MAQKLSPTQAKLMYLWRRTAFPVLVLASVPAALVNLYFAFSKKQDSAAATPLIVSLAPDGKLTLVSDSAHPNFAALAETRAKEIAETWGSFARGQVGPLQARLDGIYKHVLPEFRSDFSAASAQLLSQAQRSTLKIVDGRMKVEFVEKKNVWRAIYVAKVIEEDENARASLKGLSLGMYFTPSSPSGVEGNVLWLSALEVSLEDAPRAAKEGGAQ